jgi:glucokinase
VSVIGIDLGITRVSLVVLRDGDVAEEVARATERADAAVLLDQLEAMVDGARAADLEAVGLGLPRIVEFETGRVVASKPLPASPVTNGALDLPLGDVPLRVLLGERLGVPVFVDNHGSVSAFAEAHDIDLELVTDHLVMFTVSADVGGGLVLGGRIYRGTTGAGGELGETIIGLDLGGTVPAPMRFPQTGSLQYVAAGHALDRLATLAGHVKPESALGRLRAQGKPVLGPDVIGAAREGDQSAARMIEIWGQRIGVAVANAITTFDPEEVVIGGDAATAGDLLLEPARRVARGYVRPGLGARTTIRLARHGYRAGVLGAALLARDELDRGMLPG